MQKQLFSVSFAIVIIFISSGLFCSFMFNGHTCVQVHYSVSEKFNIKSIYLKLMYLWGFVCPGLSVL